MERQKKSGKKNGEVRKFEENKRVQHNRYYVVPVYIILMAVTILPHVLWAFNRKSLQKS